MGQTLTHPAAKQTDNIYHSVFANGIMPVLMYSNHQISEARPMHTHSSCCEFALCTDGLGIYNVDHESYHVQKGDLIYCNVGERHEIVTNTASPLSTFCLGFTNVRLIGLPVNCLIPKESMHLRPTGTLYPFLIQLCEQILSLDPRNPMQNARIQTLALSFLLTALSIPSDGKRSMPTGASARVTQLVKEYINRHYTEDIHLEDMAREFSFSAPYISHAFKSTTGYSPIQYLIRCRIGHAQTLLISGDLSVTEVASHVGYDNSNHFQTLFKQIVGTSPLQYRKKYLETLHGERDQR